MLDTDPPICKLNKPFKFEQMWFTNPSFSTLMENSWNYSTSLPSSSSLSRFQHRLKYSTSNIIDWNRNHFGNLFRKKNACWPDLEVFNLLYHANLQHFFIRSKISLSKITTIPFTKNSSFGNLNLESQD